MTTAEAAKPDTLAALDDRVEQIEERRAALERRLDEGFARIDRAAFAGHDVVQWEMFWLDLLQEYEVVCDELARAA